MISVYKRYFILFFSSWLLLTQLGFVCKSATCVFTGSVKSTWGNQDACCKVKKQSSQDQLTRASCCSYDQFQIKLVAEQHLKVHGCDLMHVGSLQVFQFSLRKQFIVDVPFLFPSAISPSPPAVKRALIQVYII
jgi:hypothetical protein